jgi:hypothetical protein
VKETDWAAGAACLGYVLGTIDAILAGGIFVNSKEGKTVYSHYYVLDSITGGQGYAIFLKYLQVIRRQTYKSLRDPSLYNLELTPS